MKICLILPLFMEIEGRSGLFGHPIGEVSALDSAAVGIQTLSAEVSRP
jgi:hypothetical protein